MATKNYNKMKILIITRYVKQRLAFSVSFITEKLRRVALAFVNVFKKKNCGASPDTAKFINDVNDSTLKMLRGY